MPIRITCGTCGRNMLVQDTLAGRAVRCPDCASPVRVPAGGAAPSARPPGQPAPPARPTGKPAASPSSSTARTVRPPSARPAAPSPADTRAAASTARVPARPAAPSATAGRTAPGGATPGNTSTAPVKREATPIGATVCPGCGKALAADALICRECGYNVKLGRKLSLSQAVREAEGGTKVKLASGKLGSRDDWAVEVRKRSHSAYLLMVTIPIVLAAAAAAFFLWRVDIVVTGPPLEVLQEQNIGETGGAYLPGQPISDLRAMAPWYAGQPVDIVIPADEVWWDKVKDGMKGGGQTASVWRLPYFRPQGKRISGYMESDVSRVLDLMRRSGKGTYREVWKGAAPNPPNEGRVLFWRGAEKPNQRGYLRGAVIDPGVDGREVERMLATYAPQRRPLRVKGTLWFIAARDDELAGPYGKALYEQLDLIPGASADYRIPRRGDAGARWYFMPVIVTDAQSITPEPDPKTAKQ